MKQKETIDRCLLMKIMGIIGAAGAVATIVLRVWVLPSVRDWETGFFTPNTVMIVALLVALAALLVLGYLAKGERQELVGIPASVTALGMVVAGLAMGVFEALSIKTSLLTLRDVAQGSEGNLLLTVFPVLQNLFGIVGGLALIALAWRLLSERATRRGIARFSALLPVFWMWLRLVNYEISYASMVRLNDSFFGLLTVILELVFLFKLARYVSGVGKVPAGMMMFWSMSAALFGLSSPVVRLIMYVMGDAAAYNAHQLSGPEDIAVGLLALVFGLSLVSSVIRTQLEGAPTPGMVDAGDLLSPGSSEEEEEVAE